ncbi:MAG: four helix bundle protein [Lewinella sp.]|nr:four helix bundle protein [Lewinella sp.]
MPTIHAFQDLQCWQKARILTKEIFLAQGTLTKDWDTRSQIRRAALSIMNNIAEGFGRFSTKEKTRFMEMAYSSGNEVKSMLFLLEDLKYLPQNELDQFHLIVDETQRLILGFIRYLNQYQG